MKFSRTDDPDRYWINEPVTGDEIIAQAKDILFERLARPSYETFQSPEDVKTYLSIQLAHLKQEVFAVLFLDNRHRLVTFEKLFFGTIDGASVHPREVVRRSIELNAAAVILAHNHPSGVAEPSQADERITQRLRDALALVDVRTLDHIIIGDGTPTSFAERGLL
jgi:DNA repair protein RadC